MRPPYPYQKRLADAMGANEEEWCHDLEEPVTGITKQRVHLIPPKLRLIPNVLSWDSQINTSSIINVPTSPFRIARIQRRLAFPESLLFFEYDLDGRCSQCNK